MLDWFQGHNIRIQLPKYQPKSLEEDPCSLMQHCLAVCIYGTVDALFVYRWGIDSTVVPYLGLLRRSFHLHIILTHRWSAEVQAIIRVWIDEASMPLLSHTLPMHGSPSPAQSLNSPTECRKERGCPSTHRRLVGGVPSVRVSTFLHGLMLSKLIN